MGLLRAFVVTLVVVLSAGAVDPGGCTSSTSTIPYITVSQLEQRLIGKRWPEPPPGARLEGFAIFEIQVSSQGEIACLNRVGGHPLLLKALDGVLRTWKFRPGSEFRGLVPVRYSSAGYELL
jgi:hypothetical protein